MFLDRYFRFFQILKRLNKHNLLFPLSFYYFVYLSGALFKNSEINRYALLTLLRLMKIIVSFNYFFLRIAIKY